MSRYWARFVGLFSNKISVGADKAGNRYFTRRDEIDGIMKEKRWVTFKGEDDPTSIPVEWICWLNGQRKSAPTPEEMAELEARREFVKLNVARLKKEEEERVAKVGKTKATSIGKAAGPNLKSFIQQFPDASEGDTILEGSDTQSEVRHTGSEETEAEKNASYRVKQTPPESAEPSGSGESFRPGTWQPPA